MKLLGFLFAFTVLFSPDPCLALTWPAPSPEVLRFEGIAPIGRGSPFLTGSFIEGAYRIFTPYGQWVDAAHPDVGTEHPSNGTDWFLNNNTRGIVISHDRSLPFYLSAFDATEYTIVLPGGRPIVLDAIRIDGASLSTTFYTAVRNGGPPEFQNFALPADWFELPLRSVTIAQPNNGFAIDNIHLIAVPEPSAFAGCCLVCLIVFCTRVCWGEFKD